MGLIDVVESRDIEQVRKALLEVVERVDAILPHLAAIIDEREVEVMIRVRKREAGVAPAVPAES